jgi:hypothetical protein
MYVSLHQEWCEIILFFFFFFFQRKEERFWEGYGSFLRIIGPLTDAIQGPSVYFDVIFYGFFKR